MSVYGTVCLCVLAPPLCQYLAALLFTFIITSLSLSLCFLWGTFYYVFRLSCYLYGAFRRFPLLLMALSPVISFAKYCDIRRKRKRGAGDNWGHVLAFNKYFKCCVVFCFSRPARDSWLFLDAATRASKSLPRLPLQATRDTKAMDIESSVHIILLGVTYTPRETRAHPTCMLIPILWPKYADKANVADEADVCDRNVQASRHLCLLSSLSPSLSLSPSCTSSQIQLKRLTWTKQIINYSAIAQRVSTLSAHEICTMCSVIEVNKKTKCLNFWTS